MNLCRSHIRIVLIKTSMRIYTVLSLSSQRAHDVYTRSAQRRCNVMTLHRRWGNVILTSCACWVSCPQKLCFNAWIRNSWRRSSVRWMWLFISLLVCHYIVKYNRVNKKKKKKKKKIWTYPPQKSNYAMSCLPYLLFLSFCVLTLATIRQSHFKNIFFLYVFFIIIILFYFILFYFKTIFLFCFKFISCEYSFPLS